MELVAAVLVLGALILLLRRFRGRVVLGGTDGDQDAAVATRLGMSAPSGARPGDQFTVRFAAFRPGRDDDARAVLAGLQGDAEVSVDPTPHGWAVGAEVEVRIEADDLELSPRQQTFVWDGELVTLLFDGEVSRGAQPRMVTIRLDAAIGGCVVARLRRPFVIGSRHLPATTSTQRAARTAFASYATDDRPRVRERLAALEQLADLDIFADRDIDSLEPWRDRIREEITSRDLFLLFWSTTASASTEIAWEMEIAADAPGRDRMRVHMMDTRLSPPPGFEDLHVRSGWLW